MSEAHESEVMKGKAAGRGKRMRVIAMQSEWKDAGGGERRSDRGQDLEEALVLFFYLRWMGGASRPPPK